jgi:predicted nucleic-acid-binding Zn-ribbon protein
MQRFTSTSVWDCPDCGHQNRQEIDVPELDFSAEKTSDMATDDWIEIVCDNCETAFTGHVYVNVGEVSFEIEEPAKFSFSGDMPMYEPEEDYEPAEDPYSIATEALGHLGEMVGRDGPANDPQFINRLVFSGAISSLEAYLGDTLINAVQEEAHIRNALLKNYNELGAISATATELADDPDVIMKRLIAKLRGYLYHNMQRVMALYQGAFAIHIVPSKAERDVLFQAMLRRHDCVHRNGRNPEGEKLAVFTDEYVREVIAAINAIVSRIEFRDGGEIQF